MNRLEDTHTNDCCCKRVSNRGSEGRAEAMVVGEGDLAGFVVGPLLPYDNTIKLSFSQPACSCTASPYQTFLFHRSEARMRKMECGPAFHQLLYWSAWGRNVRQ
jgi:hypothetical protein